MFWGMGGVFSSGNKNSIAKINNYNISTQDFMNYLNNSRIDQKIIKENIDKNILEQLLNEFISIKLLDMEIKNLKITYSEKSLIDKIKKNKNFFDENGLFSRTEYERFLLTQNITAPEFEKKIKNTELKKKLFTYVSGGIKSPSFITNNLYKEQKSKLDVQYINLENIYKKKESFTSDEIKKYVEINKEDLKIEYIDFSYVKITPANLIGENEFNELFFKKIDEIENNISNGIKFQKLIDNLKIKSINKKKFKPNSETSIIETKIYEKRNENEIQLIDNNEFYLLYNIENIVKTLPETNNKKFMNKIKKLLFEKNKYNYNKKIYDNIINKNFTNNNFINLAKNNSININVENLNSINDDNKFEKNSVKLLYSMPINSFVLVSDLKKNIYLAKIKKIFENNINKNSNDFLNYNNQANMKIRDTMYKSYDIHIANKYKVNINEKTLERVKNFFE